MFSVLLQEISDDNVFSSLETSTEIGSHQTIRLKFDKAQANFISHRAAHEKPFLVLPRPVIWP